MPLDLERILRETFVAGVEHHPTLGSTNDRAIHRAKQGIATHPLLVLADEQTAGRGRGTNRWWSGPGALLFSLVVDAKTVGAETGRSGLVALAAALAVVDTVAPLLPAHQVGIHWPNDVLAAGRKLCGILVEVLPDRRHVIGIGLNVNNTLADAPAELQTTAGTLRDFSGREHDQNDVLIELLHCLDREFLQLRSDPTDVARRADARCLQRGRMATLQWANRTIAGRCRGIAADGAILLETSAGVKAFRSGSLLAPE